MLTQMVRPYRRYAEFSGRSRRTEFWYFVLFLLLAYIGMLALFGNFVTIKGTQSFYYGTSLTGLAGTVWDAFSLASMIPLFAVTVRRLHDQDRSGWLLLLGLIPFLGWFALLVLMCLEGTHGANSYGPDPKQIHDADVFS